MDPNCPICKGINSWNCYRCRGAFADGRPWLCPICYRRPCACEADGQRVTRRLAVVR